MIIEISVIDANLSCPRDEKTSFRTARNPILFPDTDKGSSFESLFSRKKREKRGRERVVRAATRIATSPIRWQEVRLITCRARPEIQRDIRSLKIGSVYPSIEIPNRSIAHPGV